MDITYKFLLWLHLLGIALGGAASFGLPVLGAMAHRNPEARPVLTRAGKGLSSVGRTGIAVLILSGAPMVWLAWDITAMSGMFWAKMALVVALVVNVVLAARVARALAGGDASAAARLPVHGMISIALMLLPLAFGILAFR